METLSFIVLILLTILAYSGGSASAAGKHTESRPQALDLLLVLVLVAAAVYSRLTFGLNRWLLILIWVSISALVALAAGRLRKTSEGGPPFKGSFEGPPGRGLKGLWQRWSEFSKRMGAFQSRILLSLVFFLLVSPFALAVRVFSDPLGLKPRPEGSYWLPKKEDVADLESYRRQS